MGSDGVRSFRHKEQGLTLVELIVVLAIVALLSAIAIPGLARFGAFSNDTLSRETRQLYEMLTAARVYATTWNVRTAVVYNLDNYQSPQVNPTNDPLLGGLAAFEQDALIGGPIRYIEAASIMYALPGSASRFSEAIVALKQNDGVQNPGTEDAFYPVDGREGQWKRFDDSIAMLFLNPADNAGNVFLSARPRYNYFDDNNGNGVSKLGLTPGVPVIVDYPTLEGEDSAGVDPFQQQQNLIRCVAHVFTPDGRLETIGATTKERFTFYMSFRPDRPLDQRLIFPEQNSLIQRDANGDVILDENGVPKLNLQVIPIEIYRSTGRVKIAS